MKISDNFGEISRIDYWRNKTSRWKIDRAKNQWVSSKNCWNIDKCQLISKTMKKNARFCNLSLIFWRKIMLMFFWGWQSIDFLGGQVEFLRMAINWFFGQSSWVFEAGSQMKKIKILAWQEVESMPKTSLHRLAYHWANLSHIIYHVLK